MYYAPKGMSHNSGLNGYSDGGMINIDSDGWVGDYRLNHSTALAFPYLKGGGDAVGLGDYIYIGNVSSASDGTTREMLVGGALWDGSYAGLLFVGCWLGLGYVRWYFASRD